jgi:DHA2 family multidrug resistance protein
VTAAPAPETRPAGAAVWAGFAIMCAGMFMAILDVQVVATSLPTIQAALKVAPDQMSWIQTAYLIAEVIAIPLTGALTRILSLRGLFLAAIAVFTAASAGCATADGFATLIAWRILQGFAGGTLIPAVFAAVVALFPPGRQAAATTLAGVVAVLAPTLGPIAGGWITETFNWRWLFLINLGPGVACLLAGWPLLPRSAADPGAARRLDLAALALMAAALAALEIGLKEAPDQGWTSPRVLGLLGFAAAAGGAFVLRTLRAAHPIVNLRAFADRSFAAACVMSFVLGVGLFGSLYLMPVFLAYARGHGALAIGQIMLVTGAAQLVAAPIAVALERRIDARLLSAAGFAAFAIGLAMSAGQTVDTDFREMLVPQIVRGSAVMFCLLPPTRLALGAVSAAEAPDASGLFNLMRNLGGAIGLALIDTVLYGRAPDHARHIAAALRGGDRAMAQAVGIPLDMFDARPAGPLDAATQAMLKPMVETLAFVFASNDAWGLIAVLTLAALAALPFARRAPESAAAEGPGPLL